MAKSYEVDARGVRANFQKMKTQIPEIAEKAMIKAMGEGQRTAIAFAREDTGDLRRSIKRDVKVGTGRVSGTLKARVLNKKGKDYARYQELGFHHWKTGEWVEGTHYIDIGMKVARRVYKSELDRRMKELTKRR